MTMNARRFRRRPGTIMGARVPRGRFCQSGQTGSRQAPAAEARIRQRQPFDEAVHRIGAVAATATATATPSWVTATTATTATTAGATSAGAGTAVGGVAGI